jgi:hypothetical protein
MMADMASAETACGGRGSLHRAGIPAQCGMGKSKRMGRWKQLAKEYKYITYPERQIIEKMRISGASPSDIAKVLGHHLTTIYLELRRGETGELDEEHKLIYSAQIAQKITQEGFRRKGGRGKKREAKALT